MDKMGTSAEADFESWLEVCYPGEKVGTEQRRQLRIAFFGGIYVGVQVQKFRPNKAAEYEVEIEGLAKNMISVGKLDKARGVE